MCGIVGVVDLLGRLVDPSWIDSMNDLIVHRGPDDSGSYVRGSVGLGMRRLSIIDVAGGHQPVCNEDKSVWVVFNGEIYNHLELRESLEKAGHRFYTNSDTETLVHLYEQYGVDGVSKLRGMFAYALWDERAERLLLARDRVGIKPLYYAVHHGIIQRLDSNSIPCQKEPLGPFIPKRIGKHAAEFRHPIHTILLIEMDERFRIAVCIKAMPGLFKALPQLQMVVDLPVEDDPDALIFVADRLMAAGHIDNGKASHPKSDAAADIGAAIIRATVDD